MSPRLIAASLWCAAVLLTVALALFQRQTGPTYPLQTQVQLADTSIDLELLRTHPGAGGLPVRIAAAPQDLQATVRWRRFPTSDAWQELPLTRVATGLETELPHQPPAGKVEYTVSLELAGASVTVPQGEPVVARYRGDVSAATLVPHVLAMFLSMLLATRAMLGRLTAADDRRGMVLAVMVLLLLGGALLGPLVQKQAFGAYWTGWPLGSDLTDNKTAVAVIAWLPATVLALRKRQTRWSVVLGWVVMMAVFLIPHSLRGSEIDWSQQPQPTIESTP